MTTTTTDRPTEQDTPIPEIDLDKAIPVRVPEPRAALRPQQFETPDGKPGWVAKLPGNRPIATPAYADGRLFVGGGYGSYEFYAFDAKTGEMIWQIRTSDDGPTAAVVEDGLVAFNTESCSVIVCDIRDGRVVWEEWLGDPLMSQPAIADSRLFMAYPKSRGDREHYLLCVDLRSGRHLWEQPITGDVITAPVVDDGQVFFTCLDGVSFCLDAGDGSVVWRQRHAGTSCPLVVNGRVITTAKEDRERHISEGMRRWERGSGEHHDKQDLYAKKAKYLHKSQSGGSSVRTVQALALDADVGFSSSPQVAKLRAASAHLGVDRVSSAWAYQGSRPAYRDGRIYNAQGHHAYSLHDDEEGTKNWESRFKGRSVDDDDQLFLPPSLGRDYLYLAGNRGHVVSIRRSDGEVGLMYELDHSIAFQPSLAEGRIHLGTSDGQLVCLDTQDDDADGWFMWGGNARHNLVV